MLGTKYTYRQNTLFQAITSNKYQIHRIDIHSDLKETVLALKTDYSNIKLQVKLVHEIDEI